MEKGKNKEKKISEKKQIKKNIWEENKLRRRSWEKKKNTWFRLLDSELTSFNKYQVMIFLFFVERVH